MNQMSLTLAGARVHAGMRFSSVSRENRSAADARKSAETTTVVAFTFFGSGALGVCAGEDDEATGGRTGVGPAFEGVAERLGSALTVRSFPCVSMMALGKVDNLASSAAGRRVRASVNTAFTSGEASVVSDQLY